MPGKCYVVEVHVAGVGGMNHPGKVAQQIAWALEGATVPGFKVFECTGRNCTHQQHHEQAEAWLDLRASRLAQGS